MSYNLAIIAWVAIGTFLFAWRLAYVTSHDLSYRRWVLVASMGFGIILSYVGRLIVLFIVIVQSLTHFPKEVVIDMIFSMMF